MMVKAAFSFWKAASSSGDRGTCAWSSGSASPVPEEPFWPAEAVILSVVCGVEKVGLASLPAMKARRQFEEIIGVIDR